MINMDTISVLSSVIKKNSTEEKITPNKYLFIKLKKFSKIAKFKMDYLVFLKLIVRRTLTYTHIHFVEHQKMHLQTKPHYSQALIDLFRNSLTLIKMPDNLNE